MALEVWICDSDSTLSRRWQVVLMYSARLGACGLVLAILAAIFVPPLVRKARIRRGLETMSDMRLIGMAVESFALDHGQHYPSLPELVVAESKLYGPVQPGEWRPPAAWPVASSQRIQRLARTLSGRYLETLPIKREKLPIKDRWGKPFLYATTPDRAHYTIVSTGPDGRLASFHKSWWDYQTDRDLVYADGSFLEWLQWG